MIQIFGYQNLSPNSLGCLRQITPDFLPVMEFIEKDFAVFLGGNLSKQKKDFIFNSSDLLVIIIGNFYLKEKVSSKHPELKLIQGQGDAAKVANLYSLYGREGVVNLTGDFILIIKDKKSSSLALIRDKMGGKKTLFCDFAGEFNLFS